MFERTSVRTRLIKHFGFAFGQLECVGLQSEQGLEQF